VNVSVEYLTKCGFKIAALFYSDGSIGIVKILAHAKIFGLVGFYSQSQCKNELPNYLLILLKKWNFRCNFFNLFHKIEKICI